MKFRKLFILLIMSLVLVACGKSENSVNEKEDLLNNQIPPIPSLDYVMYPSFTLSSLFILLLNYSDITI